MSKIYLFMRWLAVPCALSLWACTDKPIAPNTRQLSIGSNAETAIEWFVTADEARTAAEHIALMPEVRAHAEQSADTQRAFVGLQSVRSLTPVVDEDNTPVAYIANYEYGGWSIVAADEHMAPILAFSPSGTFPSEQLTRASLTTIVHEDNENPSLPEGLLDWFTTTHDIVKSLRQAPEENVPEPIVPELWRALVQQPCPIGEQPRNSDGTPMQPANSWRSPCPPPGNPTGGTGSTTCTQFNIGPLLPTTWGQGCGYNQYTIGGTSCGHAPTGCVPTAMAQVIFFHRYARYPYTWANMPLSAPARGYQTGDVPALALLMRHCGDEVGVSYGSSSSSADPEDVEDALKSNIFGYTSADYFDGNVNFRIDNDLNAHRPSLVGGHRNRSFWGYSDGHMWVCDGMVGATCTAPNGSIFSRRDYHMNWGWDGGWNGYFASEDWKVIISSSDTRDYQYNHHVVVNIHP